MVVLYRGNAIMVGLKGWGGSLLTGAVGLRKGRMAWGLRGAEGDAPWMGEACQGGCLQRVWLLRGVGLSLQGGGLRAVLIVLQLRQRAWQRAGSWL